MSLHAAFPAIRKGGATLLQATQITAAPGEVLGVIGPNGAGKSTFLRCLAGADTPRARVTWKDRPLPPDRIGYMPQAFQVSVRLSVLECVLLGRRESLGWRVAPADLDAAEAVLARLDLQDLSARTMDTLSGGQQQRVLLAQRLVRQPLLLVLDEPTSALDLHHQIAILRLLVSHVRASGATAVLALHDLTLAARFCDRLLLVESGTLVASGTACQVLTPEIIGRFWRILPEILTTRDGHPVIVPH